MTLQDKVESFFSKAEVIQIKSENELTVMNVLFANKDYSTFSNLENHKNVREYFKNRKIKMFIDGSETKRTFSLIDIKSGDCLNIENVKFISGNFEQFLSTIPNNKHIQVFFAGLSADGDTLVLAPHSPDNISTKIRGYSYK